MAWFSDLVIGGIFAAAMVVNLLFAGLAGTFILLALDLWGGDPAVGSADFFDDSHECYRNFFVLD